MVYLPHWPIPSTLGRRQIDYETVFERMEIVLKKLKNPHQKLPPVIHVAGTNGKGSAVSLISKILTCAGYKTHIYTSPHLHDCNERIVLANEKISDSFLFEAMEETRIHAAQEPQITPLTFMEAFTIGAFLAFSKVPADVLIIECGMGGRIDATNILEKKLSSKFDYSDLLKDENLWSKIKEDNVLLFQYDSFCMGKFDNIFLNYNYIGARWPHNPLEKLSIGNGGTSFRKTRIMESISKKYKNDYIEDLFFSYYLKKDNLDNCTNEIADNFSFENIFCENSIYAHQLYNTIKLEDLDNYMFKNLSKMI